MSDPSLYWQIITTRSCDNSKPAVFLSILRTGSSVQRSAEASRRSAAAAR